MIMKNDFRATLFKDTEEELERARELFPENDLLGYALIEEVGELIQAILNFKQGKGMSREIYKEGVQSMAMIIRLLEEGSPEMGFDGFLE